MFSPLLHLGAGGWKAGKALVSPLPNPEGFQEGQFCSRLLGSYSLHSSVCVSILTAEKRDESSCWQRGTSSRAADPGGWESRGHALPQCRWAPYNTISGTTHVGCRRALGGYTGSPMQMPCISCPILPCPGLHLLPWNGIPWPCYLPHC